MQSQGGDNRSLRLVSVSSLTEDVGGRRLKACLRQRPWRCKNSEWFHCVYFYSHLLIIASDSDFPPRLILGSFFSNQKENG